MFPLSTFALALCGVGLRAPFAASLPVAAAVQESESTPPASPVGGPMRGAVRDALGQPVAAAFVVLCDSASGLPLGAETRRPFLEMSAEERKPAIDDWWFARTDADGSFAFENVPAGRYRLVAQSFPDAPELEKPQDEHGPSVHLRGVADGIDVPSAAATGVVLTPLGDATFVYGRGASNDDWYLFLSRRPLAADPVLGFLGFRGPFLREALGWSRMQAGKTTVRGLPAGETSYAIFANDSNPCFGGGTFTADPSEAVRRDTNLVGGWSDAQHDPPARLAALTTEVGSLIAAGGEKAVEALLMRGREEAWRSATRAGGFARLFHLADVLGPLDREIELASGTRATVADVMAAAAYARLATQFAPK